MGKLVDLPYGKKLYSVWRGMRARCRYPYHIQFQDYGGRGILVCDDWDRKGGFQNFYNWAIANGFADGLTIDRIDVNGNYEPSNCRWVTIKVQERNKRPRKNNKFGIPGIIEMKGKKRTTFKVKITVDGKILHVGTYKTLDEAKSARIKAEQKYWGFSNSY